jgi:CxxC motif-containing protein (DUF1111 family)
MIVAGGYAQALDPDSAWITFESGASAYAQPAPALSDAERAQFADGERSFALRWTPRSNGPWGQGPVANAASCIECHAGKGRVAPVAGEERLIGMLIRLSIPGRDEHGGPRPHPAYGDQLNDLGMFEVPAEGYASVRYADRPSVFPDGETAHLAVPEIAFEKLNFGPLGSDALISARAAPPLLGMGLLDAVDAASLRQREAEQPSLGLHGHVNEVWDVAAARASVGRFGWKANQPNLLQQVLAAFHGDMGVTSFFFMDENCMPVQKECLEKKPFMRPELTPGIQNGVLFYLRAGAVPGRRAADSEPVLRGALAFERTGCATCHRPTLTTGDYPAYPPLSRVTFHPYTDLLLHDMGPDLADGRPDFAATGSEWRTAPLWGVGLASRVNPGARFLHDARARTLLEAVLWHGGEATAAREAFRDLPKASRADLLAFLEAL